MSAQTDEQVVKEKWPQAECMRTSGAWKYVIVNSAYFPPSGIGRGDSKAAAWKDAARRVKRERGEG